MKIHSREAIPWFLLLLFGVPGLSSVLLAATMLRESTGAGILLLVIGAFFLGCGALFLPRDGITASDAGIELTPIGSKARRMVPWADVFGLGASPMPFGRPDEFVFHVWLADGGETRFLDQNTNPRELARLIQNGGAAGGPELSIEAALANGLRPDATAAVGVEPARLESILQVIGNVLRARDWNPRVHRTRLQARVVMDGEETVLELFAISRVLAAASEPQWPELAKSHYEQLAETGRTIARLESSPPALEEMRSSLRRQVMAQSGDLIFNTVIAQANVEIGVSTKLLEAWKKTDEECAEIARASLRTLPRPEEAEISKGGAGRLFLGDDWTAARVEILGDLLELPDAGAVVALPAQNALLVMPMTSPADLLLLTIGGFEVLAAQVHARELRPILTQLFWWRAGALVPIPVVMNGTEPALRIPDELSGRLMGRIT